MSPACPGTGGAPRFQPGWDHTWTNLWSSACSTCAWLVGEALLFVETMLSPFLVFLPPSLLLFLIVILA